MWRRVRLAKSVEVQFVAGLVAIIVGGAGCRPAGPIDLPTRAECAYCHMAIVDARFAVQVHSDKGRVFFLDSVECARSFVRSSGKRVAKVYFRTFLDPPRWLEGHQVWIVQWEGIRSPMGGHVAAFASEQEARNWLAAAGVRGESVRIQPWTVFVSEAPPGP